MMKVIVGVGPLERSEKFPSEKLPLNPRAPQPDHFLQKASRPTAKEQAQTLEWEKISIEEIVSIATTNSLMGETLTYKLSGALVGASAEDFLDMAEVFVSSPHTFIFYEEKLLKKPSDKVTKAGAQVVVHTAQKKDTEAHAGRAREPFSVFSIANVFGIRDRKKLWLLCTEALQNGVVPEATVGMLHWKVRDLLAKKDHAKYSRVELSRISKELVTLYHESHRGGGELALLLERFVLLL